MTEPEPPSSPFVIAVDLGGTQLRTALFEADELITRWSVPTPIGQDAIIAELTSQIERARTIAPREVSAIGISALGPVDPATGTVRDAPTITDFRNVPIRQRIEAATSLPVAVVNDANAATLAEWKLGAGHGVPDFCFVTISTGIGMGIVSGSKLITGGSGGAGELGRVHVRAPGDIDGKRLEEHASGSAISAKAESIRGRSGSALIDNARPGDLTSRRIAEFAADGDLVAGRILADAGTLVGEALANVVRVLDPTVVAIGGGVSRAGDLFWAPLMEALGASLQRDSIPVPTITPALLHDDAGLHGAAIAARNHVSIDTLNALA